jgi:hypothetical protein
MLALWPEFDKMYSDWGFSAPVDRAREVAQISS